MLLHGALGDDETACTALTDAGIPSHRCGSVDELLAEIELGAAMLVLGEDVAPRCIEGVVDLLSRQFPWSELPVLVVRPRRDEPTALPSSGHSIELTTIDMPHSIDSFLDIVRFALRSRRRQLQLQDLLEERSSADRMKNEFIALLGHELRNPLQAIEAAASLCENATDGRMRRPAQVIRRQTMNLRRMLDDLLDASRVLSGKVSLQRRRMDLRCAIDVVMTEVRPRALEARLDLRVAMPSTPVWIDADPVRVEQIVANLLGNAIRYNRPEGSIDLLLYEQAGRAVLTVRDEGLGIPPRMLGRIFEPFTQVETTLHRSNGGLGLGLPLVKGLVEALGGSVTARSEGAGSGSTFEVCFFSCAAPSHGAGTLDRSPDTPDQRLRIALVDDNEELVEMFELALRGRGYEVYSAHDGADGLALLARIRPDVALVDLGLPGIDGFTLARRYREIEGVDHRTLLLAISGYGRDEDRRRAVEAGFDQHLTKPVEVDALVAVFRGATQRAPPRRGVLEGESSR